MSVPATARACHETWLFGSQGVALRAGDRSPPRPLRMARTGIQLYRSVPKARVSCSHVRWLPRDVAVRAGAGPPWTTADLSGDADASLPQLRPRGGSLRERASRLAGRRR